MRREVVVVMAAVAAEDFTEEAEQASMEAEPPMVGATPAIARGSPMAAPAVGIMAAADIMVAVGTGAIAAGMAGATGATRVMDGAGVGDMATAGRTGAGDILMRTAITHGVMRRILIRIAPQIQIRTTTRSTTRILALPGISAFRTETAVLRREIHRRNPDQNLPQT
jgi:hypothetical protein